MPVIYIRILLIKISEKNKLFSKYFFMIFSFTSFKLFNYRIHPLSSIATNFSQTGKYFSKGLFLMGRKKSGASIEPDTIYMSPTVKNLFTPSGLPPIKMSKKVTPESILQWAYETRAAYYRTGYWLRRRGLIYLLDYYFIDPSDHPKASQVAIRVINSLPDELPKS